MRIGLSYSRCVRDIIDGIVSIDDVLVIITRTDFDPRDDNQWKSVWAGYRSRHGFSMPEWEGYPDSAEEKFRDVSITLMGRGLLHQPRQFGNFPHRLPYYWLEAVLPAEELDRYPAVKEAWDNFQLIATLTGVTLGQAEQ